jgi:hypothetical protein
MRRVFIVIPGRGASPEPMHTGGADEVATFVSIFFEGPCSWVPGLPPAGHPGMTGLGTAPNA